MDLKNPTFYNNFFLDIPQSLKFRQTLEKKQKTSRYLGLLCCWFFNGFLVFLKKITKCGGYVESWFFAYARVGSNSKV